MRMPSRTAIMQPCRLPTPSMVTRHSKHTSMRQNGARGAPDTGVLREITRPAASITAATLSPSRASTQTPSTRMVGAGRLASMSRRNMKPPRAECVQAFGRQVAGIYQRRQHEGVVRRERHPAVAGRNEGAGTGVRLIIDWKSVLGHYPQRRPTAHDIESREQRQHPHRAIGHDGENLAADGRVKARLLDGIADHHAAL